MTNAEARFNKSLRPRKPEGSLGRTAQDVHLDSHTAPELWNLCTLQLALLTVVGNKSQETVFTEPSVSRFGLAVRLVSRGALASEMMWFVDAVL